MLKKLRLKFIIVNMSIVLAMLLIIFGMLFHFTKVDLQKDAKKGRYNPLLAMHEGQTRPLADFEPMLLMVASGFAAAFDRLPLVQDAGLLKNILFEGVWTRYHEARTRQEQKEKKKEGAPE